jgi:hypothetical protein
VVAPLGWLSGTGFSDGKVTTIYFATHWAHQSSAISENLATLMLPFGRVHAFSALLKGDPGSVLSIPCASLSLQSRSQAT